MSIFYYRLIIESPTHWEDIMKKTLHMVCPHCQLKAELNIQEEAEMILMRCVSCGSPYLYFHGETFEVNESEMDHLKEAEMKEVEGLLKINKDDEQAEAIEELNLGEDYQVLDELDDEEVQERLALPASTFKSQKNKPNLGLKKNRKPIDQEDLLNLKIDLETSRDVLEFLEKT